MPKKLLATALGERIIGDELFRRSFADLEGELARAFVVGGVPSGPTYESRIINALLRYADVLSHSTTPRHRELAYGVVSLLRETDELLGLTDEQSAHVAAVTEAVLVQLGNFPGLVTLGDLGRNGYRLPLERRLVRAAKEVLQVTKTGTAVLTDTQYEIVERMRGLDYFSFSGPTSLGKSFILKDALFEIVQRADFEGHCAVILVPTKALIGQTAADLRTLFADLEDVHVATFPSLPRFLGRQFKRTVFVLTPERLLRYLANPTRDIDYLFVDEAQRVIAKDDTRSSLYYHAITEATRRFATKLVFASPSVDNPELFLELFQKSTTGALAVRERTVAQRRYFVDLINQTASFYPSLGGGAEKLEWPNSLTSVLSVVTTMSSGQKALIYVNGSSPAADFALQLSRTLPEVHGQEIDALIEYVGTYVHRDYFLAQCLRHGVAFHHGKMPQEVRERVERTFSSQNSGLRYIFCTSTLLEGVNMPAKNIFVLTDKHGPRNFDPIDFDNLIGRAGRLTHDFSGNVVCVRSDPTRWSTSTKSLLERREPQRAESFLVNPGAKRKAYTDIAHVLKGESLPGSPSADAVRSAQQYASILLLHQISQQATPLRSYFLDKVGDGRDLLRKAASAVKSPADVLRRSPDILAKYQDAVYAYLSSDAPDRKLLADDADLDSTETFLAVLKKLSRLYNWPTEEARGRDPLVLRGLGEAELERRLRYWAGLMHSWVRGDAISRVIGSSIAYYRTKGRITYRDYSLDDSLVDQPFNPASPKHINVVIEETLKDLEGGLRFRIISYLQNYYDLSRQVLGDDAGPNVASLVEYGTTDPRVIELQEVGLSRNTASALVADYSQFLQFTPEDELEYVDLPALLTQSTLSSEMRDELDNVFQGVRVGPDQIS